jgi:isoleucyl-tRNA synthetase
MFKPVDPKVNFPQLEEETLSYWKENKIFEKSVESRSEDKKWTFLDGPPFVTGLPHYGSLLSSLPKDLFGRYWTMKGYRVRRVWGWDGHGLPIENKVETKLGIKSKKEIEDVVGVKKFIDECKFYVNEVSDEWEWYIDKIARWVDFKNAYKTWDTPYMESVMWVFKQMYEKGFVYKGLRVSLYCPHCATPISNFEVAMDADNYKEIIDHGTTYKYKLQEEENTYILAWSTTPWNKIVTPALAVNPELEYVKVKQNDEFYILAKPTLQILKNEPTYEIVEKIKGSDLIGKTFEPHYDYYKIAEGEKAFEIIGGDFVTADEGTGVVTIAAYGEEDLKAMKEQNVHIEMHLDEEGTVKPEVPLFGGMYYLKANKAVNEDLSSRGLVYKDEEYAHKVPLCWRCHTRLYYAPLDAWFVDVQQLKPLLKKTNEEVNWFPKHFKYGRFLKSLENAPDWNISRNRYWGSPVPVWECTCGERFVPGSIKELEEASNQKIADLHKPEIDEVVVKCKKCGKDSKRVPEVLDSWIEAGSASFAERHFPFNELENIEDFFPPDFIAEYTGQIRAWFYVLHVIGAALYESKAFKNVAVTGVILGTDGRKMSKNYGNYPDPKEMLSKYGGDALRLYLMGSPVMHGEDIIISEEQYRQQVRGMMLVIWNVYNFFVTYANLDKWEKGAQKVSENILDQWVLSLLNRLVKEVTEDLEKYDTVEAIAKLQKFVDQFSTWYIRRSRERVGGSENLDDQNAFYSTCYNILTTFSKLLAPIAPFLAENMYRNLTDEESVHLTDWPEVHDAKIIIELETFMQDAIALSSVVHEFRKSSGVKVKIPLKELSYSGPVEFEGELLHVIEKETNVYTLKFVQKAESFSVTGDTSDQNQDLVAGAVRDIVRKIQQERKVLGTTFSEYVDVTIDTWPEEFEEEIKKKALVRTLTRSDTFAVTRINE